jgi:chromosome segregation ATPase
MSQSQEAASAIRQLEDQLRGAQVKVRAIMGEIQQLKDQEKALGARIDAKVLDLTAATREVGEIQGTIGAMRSPLGYGGAPAESYQPPRPNIGPFVDYRTPRRHR